MIGIFPSYTGVLSCLMEVIVIKSPLLMVSCYFPALVSLAIVSGFTLADSSKTTQGVPFIKMLQGGPFRKMSTRLSLCGVSRNFDGKLGASQHLRFYDMLNFHRTYPIHEV